jgi:flavorubredoxin
LINRELEEMDFQIIDPGLKTLYVPKEKDIEACYELGRKIAKALPA